MIQFANQPGVWLLLLFPALFALAAASRLWARRRASRWGGPPMLSATAMAPSLEWDMVRSACLWLALGLSMAALARPQWGEVVENVNRLSLDVVVLLDTSRSMLVKDTPPDRIERAKMEIRSFLSDDQGDRVGLVAAAGVPVMLSPLTEDHGAIAMLLDVCDENLIPAQGTDLGKGIAEALKLFPPESDRDRVILLFSDGEDEGKDTLAAARTAAALNVKLFCLGTGTSTGGLVPGPGEKAMNDPETGAPAVSSLDEAKLKQIAAISDGRYWPLATTGDVAPKIREEMGRLKRMEYASRSQARRQDHYALFLGPALLMLIMGWAIPARKKTEAEERAAAKAPKARKEAKR